MENFTSSEFHKVVKTAPSFSELNSNIDLLNNLSDQLNHPLISSHVLDYLSSDGFLSHPHTALPTQTATVQVPHHQSLFASFDPTNAGKFAEMPSSPGPGSESGGNYRLDNKNGANGRKRKRKNEAKGDKPKEVVHVRAKRGQATDSHSLAERVRRERINEKLKVLQDLVPGCYKTMGMAVMLEVIINYVQSLQNQIEFLSMKLSAASMFYDFNSPEAEVIETLHRTGTSYEAHETAILAREGYGGTLPTRPF